MQRRSMLLLGLALAAVQLTAGVCRAESKIAVVNVKTVVESYDKTDAADDQLSALRADFMGEQEEMKAKLSELYEEYEKCRDEATDRALSEEERTKRGNMALEKELEIKKYEREIRKTALLRKKQFEDQKKRLYGNILDKVTEIVSDHAKKEGYEVVLDSSGLITGGLGFIVYSSEKVDITDLVVKKMGGKQKEVAKDKKKDTE